MNETLIEALELMAVGMSLVFLVLLLVWGCVALLVRVAPEPVHVDPVPAPHEDSTTVAVIAAAVAAFFGMTRLGAPRVLSIRAKESGAWTREGRSRHHATHNLRIQPKDHPKR